MLDQGSNSELPVIPAKRYFTIGEVSELCDVKPHVLRYWEQEFTQLRPVKRGGNRRYYQHHEVLLIRRIRELLYQDGFTISGARNRLDELASRKREDADKVRAQILLLGQNVQVESGKVREENWFRVLVGPYASREQLASAQKQLAASGFSNLLLQQRQSR